MSTVDNEERGAGDTPQISMRGSPKSSDDFSLTKSQWWNEQGIERVTVWLTDDVESLTRYCHALAELEYSPEIARKINEASALCAGAAMALKLAHGQYQAKKPEFEWAAE